ncbi:nucleotide exchange factor GrpE [Halobacteriovorax marinus]|uniref:Protein GrpE n=1 Tax=Halobacteriovorax marinus (strain ATCC BAA-682 / DSM 15412 / SJ) TaxID=862908 RepID=E1X0G8_HALMS|nr:nucleotide exchange factor GrpE [Halobacteriovorax marinus]ATH09256.1 nucleotide exchange factor GrpE [Halobacteriovorax marinus]CBW27994.1 Protein grpE (HSP-70 cofactor) [Halobacteriovorax marinus SJ]
MTTENTENLEAKVEDGAQTSNEVENDNVESLETKREEQGPTEEEKAQAEQEDFKAKFYYLAAEMENLKKRQARETDNLLKYGNEKILSSLLDVLDNLDRTLSAIANDEDEKVKNIYIGVDMVKKQFSEVLTNNGLTEVESIGKSFDPNFHEAMAQQPAEGKADDEIISEFQKGYILNGRLLRAAKVVIAKN